MITAQGVEDVVPGIVNPGGPPLPSADTSADGHPKKKAVNIFILGSLGYYYYLL